MWFLGVLAAQAGSETWALDDSAWWVDGRTAVTAPGSSWTFDHGFVFPIRDGRDRVGFVFVGDGTWSVPFPDPHDARATANRLVLLEGVDPALLVASATDGADLALGVDRGLSVGLDAWSAIAPSVERVHQRDRVLSSQLADGTEHVLVVAHQDLDRARRIAEEVLRERTLFLRDHLYDPDSLLEVDRWRRAADPTVAVSLLGEYQTPFAWDRFAGATDLRVGERWLSYTNDPAGVIDPAAEESIVARTDVEGRLRMRTVSRLPRTPGPDGLRVPDRRLDLVSSGVTVQFEAEPGSQSVIGRVVADLGIVAVGGSQAVAVIDVPHVEQQAWVSSPPMSHGFVLEAVTTADGTPLPWLHLPLTGDQVDGRGAARTIAVQLPASLAPGDSVVLRLSWRDRHRYAHRIDLGVLTDDGSGAKMLTAGYDYGSTTGLLRVVPRLRGAHPGPVPVAFRVGAPRILGPDTRVVVSGVQGDPVAKGAYNWVDGRGTTAWPAVAIGDWSESAAAAAMGFPAVRTLLRRQSSALEEEAPPRVRQLLALSQGVLPPFPGEEVDIAELYAEDRRVVTAVAGGGILALHPMMRRLNVLPSEPSIRTRYPHFELFGLALALHAQWWLDDGTPSEGAGLPMAMATAFATRVVGGTYGADEADTWFTRLSEVATPADGQIPAPGDGDSHYGLGYVLGRTVVGEIGEPAWFAATTAVLDGRFPATWDGFAEAFAAGGNDVSDVFDVWVRAGVTPAVNGELVRRDGEVVVHLTTDLPFGTVRVPVRLSGDEDADLVVTVRDGVGEAVVAWDNVRMEIDPDRRLLLRR